MSRSRLQRCSTRRVAILPVVVLAGLLVPASRSGGQTAGPIVVEGRVLDASGAPLAGAEVRLVQLSRYDHSARAFGVEAKGEGVAAASTDVTGRYRLEVPEPAVATAVVETEEGVVMEILPFAMVGSLLLPPVRLPAVRRVQIEVLGGEGEPLPGASVWVADRRQGNRLGAWDFRGAFGETDEAGRAHLVVPTDGDLQVSAYSPARLGTRQMLAADDSHVRLRLRSAETVAVLVEDDDGVPAKQALVSVFQPRWSAALTDESGRATLAVPAGWKELSGVVISPVGVPSWFSGDDLVEDPETGPSLHVVVRDPPTRRGQVVELGTGEPVAGALVWGLGDPGRFVRSGADGSFELQAADERLVAAARGYVSENMVAQGFLGLEPDVGTLYLRPAGSLEGRVTNTAGEPVPGALVQAVDDRYLGGFPPVAVSDAEGGFRLSPVVLGDSIRLVARHPEYAAEILELAGPTAREPHRQVEVVLHEGCDVTGTVLDRDGSPVAGARVHLDSAPRSGSSAIDAALPEQSRLTSVTDEEGRFRFARQHRRMVRLRVEAEGFATVQEPEIELDQDRDTTLWLEPGAELVGRVVNGAGEPVSRAHVSVRGRFPGWTYDSPEWTDEDGRFRLGGLRDGETVQLSVSGPDNSGAGLRVTVPSPEPLELVLVAETRVSGRVVDADGVPVADARVSLLRKTAHGSSGREDVVGPGGAFALATEAGRVVVTPMRGGQAGTPVELDVEPGEQVTGLELVLPDTGVTLAGIVLDASGQPVAGAVVSRRLEGLTRGGLGTAVRTDGAGRFELTQLDPGSQSLLLEAAGLPPTEVDLELMAGRNSIEVRFDPGYSISGRILRAGGEPMAGAELRISSANRVHTRRPAPELRTASDGTFTVPGLAPGSHSIYVREGMTRQRPVGTAEVVDGPVDLGDLWLGGRGSITGRVLGLEPELRSRAWVSIFGSTGASDRIPLLPDGSFRFEDLPSGRYRVMATLQERGRQARQTLELEEGEEAVVDLDLGRGLRLAGTVLQEGAPLEHVSVTVTHIGSGTSTSWGRTDLSGHFQFEGLEAGRHRLSVRRRRATVVNEAPFERDLLVETDTEIEVTLESASLAVSVSEAAGGLPLGGALIRLAPHLDMGRGSLLQEVGRSREDGSFAVADLSPGTYRLEASLDGYAPATADIQVHAGTAARIQLLLSVTAP